MDLTKQRTKTAVATLLIASTLLTPCWLSAQDTNSPASADAATSDSSDDKVSAEASDDSSTNASDSSITRQKRIRLRHRSHGSQNAKVVFGHDVELKEGETNDAVVVIGGLAIIRGKVNDAAVVIGGNLDVEGEVGDAAVAVLGNVRVGQGAVIHGDVVAVGGSTDVAKGAKIEGEVHDVDFGATLPRVDWLKHWLQHCVFKLRPLAPQVGWVWVVWGILLLLYLLVAAAFPRPVQACVDELTRRPATTFLMGLLTKLLLPIVIFILAVTVIGAIVIPFVFAALFLGFIVGKVAILEALGFQLGRQFSGAGFQKPVAALLLGAAIITVIYLIPVLGLIAFGITSVWGLGAAVMAGFGGFRKEMPQKPSAPPAGPAPAQPIAPSTSPSPSPSPAAASFAMHNPQPVFASPAPPAEPANPRPETVASPTTPVNPPAPATLPDAWSFPKASFWERMGAAFLDIVLVSILGGIVGGPPQGFLVALAYFAGMWAWKGTTVGGVVLGLKIARLDGQPITFMVALVRALAGAFSIIIFFLGILWIIWDKDKQGWHDRIAGTVVVKLPKAMPLICL